MQLPIPGVRTDIRWDPFGSLEFDPFVPCLALDLLIPNWRNMSASMCYWLKSDHEGRLTAVNFAANDHARLSDAGLHYRAVLRVVVHDLLVTALDLLAGDVVPDIWDGVQGLKLEAYFEDQYHRSNEIGTDLVLTIKLEVLVALVSFLVILPCFQLGLLVLLNEAAAS